MFDDICKKATMNGKVKQLRQMKARKEEYKRKIVLKIRNNADRKKATSNYINQADYLLQANVLQTSLIWLRFV